MNKINIALIGYGRWGPNYMRVIRENMAVKVTAVCDVSTDRMENIRHYDPSVKIVTDYNKICEDAEIDAVVVATPVTSHYEIVKKLLLSGKHVLCEKALTLHSEETLELDKLAKDKGLILMVGHVFLFNNAVEYTKHCIEDESLGKLMHFYFRRTGLGPIRDDVNVMWDLATHDVSIIMYLLEKMPVSVTAFGKSYIQKGIEDVAFIVLEFPDDVIANIHVSWIDPVKERKMTLVGQKKMLVFDDVSITEKLKIFDKGVSYQTSSGDYGEFQAAIRDGEVVMPNVKFAEPLKAEFNHFIESLQNNTPPLTDGYNGYQVIKVLEAAQKSLESNSLKINL